MTVISSLGVPLRDSGIGMPLVSDRGNRPMVMVHAGLPEVGGLWWLAHSFGRWCCDDVFRGSVGRVVGYVRGLIGQSPGYEL